MQFVLAVKLTDIINALLYRRLKLWRFDLKQTLLCSMSTLLATRRKGSANPTLVKFFLHETKRLSSTFVR